ncbi:AAA family ATPase [Actinopolyspora mortivallis]|uniref:AAA family ATPase n=1 Tax=Actinopolyspora mortivallis TaxID=33906 RepID=UPI0003640AEB|nr:SMC family ATPase [Actinopolyspora mortivallis]
MRLHRLELSAFGPFRDRQAVDFDELGADGLFLLHGDTGAGKTTVLDAIVFALYGEVPGARNQAKALRCDTAEPGARTWVALELSVRGHRLRLERNPEYRRLKRDGSGHTDVQHSVSLSWLSQPPEGEPREGLTRAREVGQTVRRLLGMSAEQFCHVALLPQGDFARFLRADAGQRADLLEQLFGTGRYSEVERWFKETRQLRGGELERVRAEADRLVARITQVAGEEPDADADRVRWLDELEKDLVRRGENARAEHRRLDREREGAERTLTARRELADKVDRARRATAELTELSGQEDTVRRCEAELDAARRAVAVVNADREWETGLRRLRECERLLRQARTECPDVDATREAEPAETLRAWAVELREEAAVLAEREAEAEQQHHDQRRVAELEEEIAADSAADAELAERQGHLPEEIERARARSREAEQAPQRLETLTARCAELEEALRAARELPEADARCAEARLRAQRAVDEHQTAREHLQDVRERRLAGMAAELAGDLCEGTACPVCGATRHPDPADPAEQSVGSEDERRAREAEALAQRRRDEERATLEEAERECARLREQLSDRTEPPLREEYERVSAERAELEELVEQRHTRAERLAELEADVERVNGDRVELANRISANRSARDSLLAAIEQRRQRLRAARGEFDTVAARRNSLIDRAEHLDRVATARDEHERALEREAEQRRARERVAVENGFATAEEALEAARERRRIDEVDEWLARVRRREAAARATLDELAGVDPEAEVDVEEAAAEAERARLRAEEAGTVAADLERRATEIAELGGELRRVHARLEPVEAEFAELDALTDVINGRGQNARRMTLRSYVLAARLEQVAEAATVRLRHMSDGRYSFEHSDEQGPHGKRGGLDLRVRDDYSGRSRSTRTLSGGETFLASLSLALGLADVVGAEAGGAMLDTLFIDEGFGTLDGDTLDLVMDALDELRAGGRVVGLVSHVDELRQRIPVRLRVRKSRSGSSLGIES